MFDSFTFAFVDPAAGWLWCHAYGFSASQSTFIVECTAQTWTDLGLDTMSASAALAMLEDHSSAQLDAHPLLVKGRSGASCPGRHSPL